MPLLSALTDRPRPTPSSRGWSWALAAICALTVGLYALLACTRDSELGNRTAADAYYNLLVSGFRSGQLSLKQEAPAGLAALADPYDPEASAPFRGSVYTDIGRVHDLSYFRGRLYLYFGITPALLLFWPLAAALGPIAAVGVGLMVYNQLRFGSPSEFGQTYQLAGDRQDRAHFGLGHLWFNLRAYYLAPASWSDSFPFVQPSVLPTPPAGHGGVEAPFGALAMMPFTWLALALPVLRRSWADTGLRAFLAALAWVFATSALVLGCFYGTCSRYEAEFVPALVLLAAIGAFALDAWLAAQPVWRSCARLALSLALAGSVGFNLLAATEERAQGLAFEGSVLVSADRAAAAVLAANGRPGEALPHFQEAVRLAPANAGNQANLGMALAQAGRPAEARAALQQALQLDPGLEQARALLARLPSASGSPPSILRQP